jgi:hypothetical protein
MPCTDPNLFGWGARPQIKRNAAEYKLQCQVAKALKKFCDKRWRYTHLPFGEKRDRWTSVKLHLMGVTPGWPDLLLIGPGKICFMELKRPKGGRMSAEQKDICMHIMVAGGGYALVDNYDDAIDALKDWGALPMTFHPQ